MAKDVLFEIWVRKGEDGGVFTPKDPSIIDLYGEMCALAKQLVDSGQYDEAVVLEKRVVQRFRRYEGQG